MSAASATLNQAPADVWRPAINPWIIALTVTLATFMEVLDTSIANVALPHIAGGLSAGQDESTWVLTSYLVSNAIVLPLSGWLSSIIGRKNFPADDLKGMIAFLKANPDGASVGIAGVGATGHLTGIALQKETGTKFTFVPYRGNGPAMQDLLSGQIDFMIEPSSNFRSMLAAGSAKPFAVTSKTRLKSSPEIPTADEAGLPGFVVSLWYGLWVPKNTPKEIIAKLNTTMVQVLASPPVKQRFDEIVDFSGVEKFIDTPVKRYSVGMYARLAFAVAAHLEAEVLVIDEVLAVGDAEFQKRCLDRMSEVAGSGRTVLFVSHNFAAVTALMTLTMPLAAMRAQPLFSPPGAGPTTRKPK